MKRFKKWLLALMAVSMFLGVATACTDTDTEEDQTEQTEDNTEETTEDGQ